MAPSTPGGTRSTPASVSTAQTQQHLIAAKPAWTCAIQVTVSSNARTADDAPTTQHNSSHECAITGDGLHALPLPVRKKSRAPLDTLAGPRRIGPRASAWCAGVMEGRAMSSHYYRVIWTDEAGNTHVSPPLERWTDAELWRRETGGEIQSY